MEKTDSTHGEDVKRLVQDLGTTIQRTLSESTQIAFCLNRIRSEGFEVSLVLEATIGFSKTGTREPAEVRMTPLDKKFLRSLKISIGEEE
jgi:hypothetical protein